MMSSIRIDIKKIIRIIQISDRLYASGQMSESLKKLFNRWHNRIFGQLRYDFPVGTGIAR